MPNSRSFICWESFGGRFVVNCGSIVDAVVDSGGTNTVEIAINSFGIVVDADGVAVVVSRLSPTI